jgi:chitinase
MNAVRSGSWTYNWDNASKVPYYTSVSPPRLISFDDSVSIAIKCQYARSKGVSGVMIWELSQDVIGREQPLMDVVGAQMIATTGVPESQSNLRSAGFALFDNYPNPFSAGGGSAFGRNPSTTIRFAIPVSANISIKIFDMLGREVATLLNEYRNAGTGNVRFDASHYDITIGVYFYRIQAGAFTQTKKLILVK